MGGCAMSKIKEMELACGIKVIGVPGWGEPMLISFTDFQQDAKTSLLVPNDWEYTITDTGMGGFTIEGKPIYDSTKPKHVFIKDAIVLKGITNERQ
jgi:hypothetical protein